MNWNVLSAIFKRNFASYFSSPTGYVFICVFVVLSSLAEFWSPEFFSSNLANLDQLSKYMPFILLVFIPAITMSLWAEERKEGTDELLLTIPASDLDVVLGKYLAAVAIFTTSLLFSAFSIYLIFLWGLGYPDLGLFIGTYIGYWFIGIAMLAVGMIASFLTRNLTVAFILGMLFNFPLAVAGVADALVPDPYVANAVRRWSAAEQLQDFERGVISLSGMSYFLLIAVVGVYLSVVLIGRRHWRGGKDGSSMLGHYLARVMALVAIVLGANIFFSSHDWLRADITGDRLSSLSPDTKRLIQQVAGDDEAHPIKIDVYASPQVPAEYVETKLNLLSTVDEMASRSGGKIQVQKHIIASFSDEASRAEETFGIEPREVSTRREGKRTQEEIFLGFAVTSGLDKVVVPFVDRGVPIEYELIRSIVTMAQDERKTLGIVRTDVPLFGGGFSMMGGQQPESELVSELKKQYEVVEIDPSSPIEEEVDVLLAVQPSTLDPAGMDNFVEAVKSGIPTAILEDPLPVMYSNVVGTTQPKQPPGGMFGMGGPPPQKGDINQLWSALGVEMVDGGDSLIWQNYNPEPKAELYVQPEFIFIDKSLAELEIGAYQPFNAENAISAGMRQVLFLFAGAWSKDRRSKLEYAELASTGKLTGTVGVMQTLASLPLLNINPYAYAQEMRYKRVAQNRNKEYKVAVYVHGKRPLDDVSLSELEGELEKSAAEAEGSDENTADEASGETDAAAESASEEVPQSPDQPELKVALVADIDWVAPAVFQLRQIGSSEDFEVNWKFQNVTFLLNMLDFLAGEDDFIEIRKRERTHRLLTQIEQETSDARARSLDQQTEFIKGVTDEIASFRQDFQKRLEEMQSKWADLPARERQIQVEILRRRENQRLDAQISAKEQEQKRAVDEIQRELDLDIERVQRKWKILALVLPPIPPMLLAFFVFFHRRRGEQEGVASSRLR